MASETNAQAKSVKINRDQFSNANAKASPELLFPSGHYGFDAFGASRHRALRGASQYRFIFAAASGVVLFAVLFTVGIAPRLKMRSIAAADARREQNSAPLVFVSRPQRSSAPYSLSLPGNIDAIQQTSIYARSSGYLKRWFVDIGDNVRAGQLVALVEAPEVDQQLNQAKAQLAQARAAVVQSRANYISSQGSFAQQQANLSHAEAQYAQAVQALAQNRAEYAQSVQNAQQQKAQLSLAEANLNLANVTAQRYQNLAKEGAIDQETADQTQTSYLTGKANVESIEAGLRASKANTDAYESGVQAGEANVKSFADAIKAAQAAVKTAQGEVLSAKAAISAAQANALSYSANVARSAVLVSYERVTAPFSGVITARNVDVGALINGGASSPSGSSVGGASSGSASAGSAASGDGLSGASAQSSSSAGSGGLFSVAQIDKLRVYVNIPQTDVFDIRSGQEAQILFREYPGRKFTGKVVRSSAALDPVTRTLVAEVQLTNRGGLLRPGMFAQVRLKIKPLAPRLLVPDNAVVADASGVRVEVVADQNKIRYQPVTLGRDYGKVIEVLSGLRGDEQILTNPDNTLQDGEIVKPFQQAEM